MSTESEYLHERIDDRFMTLSSEIQHPLTEDQRKRCLDELRKLTKEAEALFQRRRVGGNPPD